MVLGLEEFRRVLRKKHYLDTLSSLEIRDLVDAADTKIFSIDDSCLVRLWNKKMAEFTRVSEDDCVGQPLHEVLGGLHYPDTFYHKVYAALHGEETLGFECPVYDAKGFSVYSTISCVEY
jgi:PAS domain-containing protein